MYKHIVANNHVADVRNLIIRTLESVANRPPHCTMQPSPHAYNPYDH